MPRLRNKQSGAIVSVPAEKVERLGSEWAPVDENKAPVKKASTSKSSK